MNDVGAKAQKAEPFEVGETLYCVNYTFNEIEQAENLGYEARYNSYIVACGTVNMRWHAADCFKTPLEAANNFRVRLTHEIEGLQQKLQDFQGHWEKKRKEIYGF